VRVLSIDLLLLLLLLLLLPLIYALSMMIGAYFLY